MMKRVMKRERGRGEEWDRDMKGEEERIRDNGCYERGKWGNKKERGKEIG